jgi:selenocysteine lyase/cysteine desulfurase
MIAGAVVGLPLSGRTGQANLPSPPSNATPSALARDETFWSQVATYYDRTEGIVNLEHGYWGKMAHPVQDAYINATRMVNAQNSFYARKQFFADESESVRRVASALGVHDDEIVLTRNATEAIHNLIRQYRGLAAGDAVLFADKGGPGAGLCAVSRCFRQEPRHQADVADAREQSARPCASSRAHCQRSAKTRHRRYLRHGPILGVARLWAGFNLHKWIGTPVGVGALYMRRGSLQKVAPYPGESDPENILVSKRVHVGTANFAATLAVPHALDFHQAIGAANKEARLRYLRQLWTNEAESMSHIELLGGLDEESWTGMGSFRLTGRRTAEEVTALQQRLEQEFGIFTVVRKGLASGYCVRVTPQVFTPPDDLAQLLKVAGLHTDLF